MQRFSRSAIHTHAIGQEWPSFLGRVQLDEAFVIETDRGGGINGPIEIAGIEPGDALAIRILEMELVGPFELSEDPYAEETEVTSVDYHEGCFYFPGSFRVQANPTVGSLGVLPRPTDEALEGVRRAIAEGDTEGWRRLLRTPQGKHCHRDCPWLAAGATMHLSAQVEGAGLCIADVHGYRPAGRLAHSGIEVAADVTLCVSRSEGWLVEWPLIETDDDIMVMVAPPEGSPPATGDRMAYTAMRDLVAARAGVSAAQAGALVAAAVELQACSAPAPMTMDKSASLYAVVATLPKDMLERVDA